MNRATPRTRLASLLATHLPRVAFRFARHLGLSDEQVGRAGEALAARWLARAGLEIHARRLQTRCGEVDLLARDAGTWVCVEVKTGHAGPRFRPAGRIDRRKFLRLRAAADCVASEFGGRARIDVVEVALRDNGRLDGVRHLRSLDAPP